MDNSARMLNVLAGIILLLTLLSAGVCLTAPSHTVTVEIEGKGFATPSEVTVGHDRSTEITLTPVSGWELSSVTANGTFVAVDGSVLHLKHVKEDILVKALFEKIPDTVVLTTVSGEGGIIDLFGHDTYAKGTTASAAVLPDEGKTLCSLKIDGVPVKLTNLLKIEMDSGHTVEAEFRDRADSDVLVSVSVSVDGKSDVPGRYSRMIPSASFYAEFGSDVVFSIEPAGGYLLSDMVLNGTSVGVQDEYAISDLSAPVSFGFVLNKSTYSVAITHSEHGRLSPSGTVTVARGSEFTVTILPDNGYRLSSLIIDGESVGVGFEKYTFKDIVADHIVYAEFEEIPVPPGQPDFTAWVCKVIESDGMHTSERTVNAPLSDGDPFTLTNIATGVVQMAEIELRNTGDVDLDARLCLSSLICTSEDLILAGYIEIVCTVGTETHTTKLSALVDDQDWSVDLISVSAGDSVRMTLKIALASEAGNTVQGKTLSFTLQINAYAEVQ